MKISNEYVLNDRVFAPQKKEQQKIAHFFTTLDKKINQLEKKKNGLEQYKKGMMQQIFSQELRFKDENGSTFPDWEVSKFGEIFEFHTTNSLSRDKLNYSAKGVRNIHYGDIHTKFSSLFNMNKEYVPFINGEVNLSKINKENYCKIGDLVIADASEDYLDIGKTIEIIELNDEKVLSGLHTILARPKINKTSLGFSGYLMQSKKIRSQVMIIAQGTKVLGLSSKQLSKADISLPNLKEQTKIANFLSKIDNKINAVNTQIEQTNIYKKGLSQSMFVN
jgi:type I restriction enzyme S subunit